MSPDFLAIQSISRLDDAQAPKADREQPRRIVVFVHGIRSSHETFIPLLEKLRARGVDSSTVFRYFDYNYRHGIAASGVHFADALTMAFDPSDEVTIVGHSMGGLVGRFALLQRGHELPFVCQLVMLGTPNHGTLHTGRMGLLAQMNREITGTIWALLSRKTGVKELTEVNRLMKTHLSDETQQRTFKVDYLSIPATCYHEEAGLLKSFGQEKSLKMATAPLFFELMKAHPCWRVGLEVPHDGIVEESSVFLGNRGSVTRRSERLGTCRGETNCGTYLHVRHSDYLQESHVTLQIADRTADILSEVLFAPSLADWKKTKSGSCEYDFDP